MIVKDWEKLDVQEKISFVTEVLDREIRDYMARDGGGGGVDVVDIVDGNKVIISYKGACRGCPAALGGTLSAIQQILKEHVADDIEVIPDFLHK